MLAMLEKSVILEARAIAQVALHAGDPDWIPNIPYGPTNTPGIVSECRAKSNP